MMRHLLQYIATNEQVADMLTKPLSGTSLEWYNFFSPVVRIDLFPSSRNLCDPQ
jgi:hypothetical protein